MTLRFLGGGFWGEVLGFFSKGGVARAAVSSDLDLKSSYLACMQSQVMKQALKGPFSLQDILERHAVAAKDEEPNDNEGAKDALRAMIRKILGPPQRLAQHFACLLLLLEGCHPPRFEIEKEREREQPPLFQRKHYWPTTSLLGPLLVFRILRNREKIK